uniref:F-box domain-containing protein n=1 Tax=Strongyloides venezuelensis TaxID=75913 RepID=A0A0K0FI21_STRVS
MRTKLCTLMLSISEPQYSEIFLPCLPKNLRSILIKTLAFERLRTVGVLKVSNQILNKGLTRRILGSVGMMFNYLGNHLQRIYLFQSAKAMLEYKKHYDANNYGRRLSGGSINRGSIIRGSINGRSINGRSVSISRKSFGS